MAEVAVLLLQNAAVATAAGIALFLILRWTSVNPRVERLLWLMIAARFLLPPFAPAPATIDPLAAVSQVGAAYVLGPTLSGAASTAPSDRAIRRNPGQPHGSQTQGRGSGAAAGPVAETAPVGPAAETASGGRGVSSPLTQAAIRLGLVLWAAGAVVLLAAQLLRILVWRRTSRMWSAPPELTDLVEEVAEQLNVKGVLVFVTDGVDSPAVSGLFTPRLLWPPGLLDSTGPGGTRTLIAHELAHVRHLDLWVSAVELVLTSVWWWYPGWYWVRHELRDATERACDARVVELYPKNRRDFADALLDALAACSHPDPVMARGLGELRRIRRRLSAIFEAGGSRLVAFMAGAALLGALAPSWLSSHSASEEPSTVARTVAPAVPVPSAAHGPSMPPAVAGHGLAAPAPERRATSTGEKGATEPGPDSAEPPGDSVLLARLRSADPLVRKRAVGEVVQRRLEWAMPWIYPLATDSVAFVRRQVAVSVGIIEPEGGLQILADLLDDDDARVRESATWALTGYGADEVSAAGLLPLLQMLSNDPDPGVRRQVAATIAMTEVDGGVRLLLPLLEDESAAVRANAVWGLGDLRRTELTRRIVPLATDTNPGVREGVARALWLLPSPEWREAVERLAADSAPEVRAKGRMALNRFRTS